MNISESNAVGSTVRVMCDHCGEAVHRILAAVDYNDKDPESEVQLWGSAQVIQCQGCEAVGFRDSWRSSEDHASRYVPEERLYPPRIDRVLANQLYLRQNVDTVPTIVKSVYRETLAAVQHGLATLAGIGIRTIIEATCQELKAKAKTLEGKIDELVRLSLLTPAGAEILHGIRLLGNDAAHQMKAPDKKQIVAALKVIDHLLLGVYVLPKEAAILPKRAPKTSAPAKKASSGAKTEGTGQP
jgi:hypothetical protein